MMLARLMIVAALLVLAACGESKSLACDEGPYQVAVRAPKVQSPEGLDSLDPLAEMPLPAASPQAPRPADGPCLEHPPEILKIE
jgi:uncharacterized lipoprotein